MSSLTQDALRDGPGQAPDDLVDEVAGPPFSPIETTGAIGMGVVALLMAGMMALLLSALAEEHRLSAAGIGQAAMLEALTTGLTTGLAGIFLKPMRLKLIGVIAAFAAVLVDLATSRAAGPWVFAARALGGVPEGLLLWIAIGLISRTKTPERWAAVLFTGLGVSQLVFATLMSTVFLPRYGAAGGYVAVAAATLLAVPFALIGPSRLGHIQGAGEAPTGAPPPKGWLALGGTLAFAASLTCVGVYIVPLAVQAGIGLPTARFSISVGLACQIAGAAIATALAGHIRWIHVFWGSGLIFLVTWLIIAGHPPAWLFLGLTGLSALGGSMAAPFLVPMTVEADPSRRAAMQSGTIQLLAGALGPLAGSFAVKGHDLHGVLLLAAVMQMIGLAVATGLHRMATRV